MRTMQLRVVLGLLALVGCARASPSQCREDEVWIPDLGLCARNPDNGPVVASRPSPSISTDDGSVTVATVAGEGQIDDVHFELSDMKT